MNHAPAEILHWILAYKYFVLLPIVAVEGPIVTILAGVLASMGRIDLLPAYGLVVAGDLVGDSFYYWLGRSGRTHVVQRWGHYLGVTPERIERLERHFGSHSGKTLIVGKLSHAVGGVVLIAAGASRMPFGRYLGFNLVATLPKSLALLLLGYYFGQAYHQLAHYLNDAAVVTVALAVLLVLVYLVVRRHTAHPPDSPDTPA
jgi:membrane protein DedA with SNARE-associated domain